MNFDQLNYHTYSAYAFLHGRMDADAAPAEIIHSYFNPLVNLPYYCLLRAFGPRAASLAAGAAQGAAFWLAAVVAAQVATREAAWRRRVEIALALLVSAASPMALSETGTSFTDTLTAVPVLAALALLLRPAAPGAGAALLPGALAGAAAALKLTNAVFVVGLLAAALAAGPRRIRSAALLGAGAALGFAAAGGWWCATLWSRFGNPFFPYYNGVFRSRDYAPTSFSDRRMLPDGVADALAYPFRWAAGLTPPGEAPFQDVRFAAILCLLAAGALVAVWRRRSGGAGPRLLVFWAVSFGVWLGLFAVQRYIAALELLCGPAALAALGLLARGRTRTAAAAALAAAAVATVAAPDWGHVPFAPGLYGLQIPAALADDGLFFMAGEPVSYVIPAFSPRARFFGIMEWEDTAASARTTLTRRIERAVAGAGDRPIRVIANAPLSAATLERLDSYGLRPTDACTALPGYSPTGVLTVCELARVKPGGGPG